MISGHRMDSKPLVEQITVLDQAPSDSQRKVLESIHIMLRGATVKGIEEYQLPDLGLYMPLLHEESGGVPTSDLSTASDEVLSLPHSRMKMADSY